MKSIKFSDDLSFPIDVACQTLAFIARKGAGKTYAAGVLVEGLVRAGVQVVILDVVGNWYGLRISADGKSEGLDIPVLGGLRGDIPLTAEGGALTADIVADSGRSLIVDVSQFSQADRKRFAAAFGRQLWKRKKAEPNPSPVHLVLEECQLIIPQMVRGDDAAMVGIFEEIVRLGRNFGIGVSMITQRPQSVNKEVLTQTECLVVLQVNGVPERKALKEWVTHQGMSVDLLNDLPSLPIGTAWVWSPQWLQILQKVKIVKKTTLDASSTPRVGEKRTSRELKPLDLADLREKMAATIEENKKNDPRELRKLIADLQRQVAAKPPAEKKIVDRPVVTESQIKSVESIIKRLEAEGLREIEASKRLLDSGERLRAEAIAFKSALSAGKIPSPIQAKRSPISDRPTSALRTVSNFDGSVTPVMQKILNSLAWWEMVGVSEPKKQVVAVIAGYTVGGYFNNTIGAMRTAGLIKYPNGGQLALTDMGRSSAEFPASAGTVEQLHAEWKKLLSPIQWKIVEQVIFSHPHSMTKEEIAGLAGLSIGGYFNNTLGSLRTLGVVSKKGDVAATSLLFPESLTGVSIQ